MKFLLLILCFPIFVFAQSNSKILNNSDIIKLSKLELPPSTIISKIKTCQTHFNVEIDDIVELKKQGVNSEVITAMINANAGEQKDIVNQKDNNDPKVMRRAGIYYYNTKDTNSLFIVLDPTVFSNTKSSYGIGIAQAYSLGLAKSDRISSLSGAESRIQIRESKPTFYFYFQNQNNNMNTGLWWFSNASVPNEFSLVKLIEKEKRRDIKVGSLNAYEHEIGIDENQKVDFIYEQVATGIYKVTPKNTLARGEYCFIFTGAIPLEFINYSNKVFDFGISIGQFANDK